MSLALLFRFWKPLAIVGVLAALFVWHKTQIWGAHNEGRKAVITEQAHEAAKRNNNANAAEAASRECSRNPACRLSDDGHRRD